MSRVRAGDREAAAELVRRHGDLIRARIRRRLPGSVRRLFDSQDILSTLYRRMDHLTAEGHVRAQNEGELLGLLIRIAQNAVVDKARIVRRLERAEGEDAEWARSLLATAREASPDESATLEELFASALERLEDDEDRMVLSLWLQGLEQTRIAGVLGLTREQVWWRWRRIRRQLRDGLQETAA